MTLQYPTLVVPRVPVPLLHFVCFDEWRVGNGLNSRLDPGVERVDLKDGRGNKWERLVAGPRRGSDSLTQTPNRLVRVGYVELRGIPNGVCEKKVLRKQQ